MSLRPNRFFQLSAESINRVPVIIIACVALIILGACPIAFSWPPFPTYFFFQDHLELKRLGRGFLLVLMTIAIFTIARFDPEKGVAKGIRYCGFALVAALLTDIHFYAVDVIRMDWQIEQYGGILRHSYAAPDQYRFLPQGTLWWLILCNGDFLFSYLSYRFFFTFLVCLSIYKLARLYLSSRDSVIVVGLYSLFYPLSTRYYHGNLLDPMSHSVMMATFYYCNQRKFSCVFWLFVLGTFIKETMLVIAPCYYLMNLDAAGFRDYRKWLRVLLLGIAGLVVFFVCRIPFHFNYDLKTLNRTSELMIYANLGLVAAKTEGYASILQRYIHPLLFIFMWLPLIVWKRRFLPAPLFWTSIYFAAAIYLTNLFFGWNYESRNFVPALVLLLICTGIIVNKLEESSRRTE